MCGHALVRQIPQTSGENNYLSILLYIRGIVWIIQVIFVNLVKLLVRVHPEMDFFKEWILINFHFRNVCFFEILNKSMGCMMTY